MIQISSTQRHEIACPILSGFQKTLISSTQRHEIACPILCDYYKTYAPNIHFGIFSNETTNVHIWSAWFCTYFDAVTKIFCAQIFTTTITTKAKLILNKLSEVHTYWRFNEHTYSDFVIKNIQLFDDNINLMHLWNDAFQIICMRSHMHEYSHVLRVLWMAASWVHDSVEHQQSSVVVVPSSFDACSTAVSSGSGLLRLPRPTGFMMLFWSSSGHSLPRHPGPIHGFKSASQKTFPLQD